MARDGGAGMTTGTIHQRIAAVMKDLRGVEKSSRNKHFEYMYAGHEAINAAMRPLFLHHGITQTITCTEFRIQSAPTVCSCMVLVRWACTDDPSSYVEGNIPALMPASAKSGFTPQMAASLISYGCKGFALKTLMLTDSNEDDAGSWEPEPEPAKVDPAAASALGGMLARFAQLNTVAEVKAHDTACRARWDETIGVPDRTERYAAARKDAIERIKGAAQ